MNNTQRILYSDSIQLLDQITSYIYNRLSSSNNIQINFRRSRKRVHLLYTFIGTYQRSIGVLSCLNKDQPIPASILLRSIYELAANLDFVFLEAGTNNLTALHFSDFEKRAKSARKVRDLRREYPNADTLKRLVSDADLEEIILRNQNDSDEFRRKNPWYSRGDFPNLHWRMKKIDDFIRIKSPNRRHLLQIDYYTGYNVLSNDVHASAESVMNGMEHPDGPRAELNSRDESSLSVAISTLSALLSITKFFNRNFAKFPAEDICRYDEVLAGLRRRYKRIQNTN